MKCDSLYLLIVLTGLQVIISSQKQRYCEHKRRHEAKKSVQTLSFLLLLFKSLGSPRNRETPSYRYTVEENNNTFILNVNCPFLVEENPGVNPSNRT